MEVPSDLEQAFREDPPARVAFDEWPDSKKRQYLWWINTAKKSETRSGRIAEAVALLLGSGPAWQWLAVTGR